MSETSLIVSPKAQITIGGKSLQEIPDAELVDKMFKEAADRLVLRAESIEIIGNERVQAVASSLLSDITKFIKDRNDATDTELRPFKDAMAKIKKALELLLTDVIAQKTRIIGLTSKFAEHQRQIAAQEQRKQREETARIQREAAALEEEKKKLQEQKDLAAIAAMQPKQEVSTPANIPAIQIDQTRAIVQKEQELNLRQAELNRQAAEASKVIEAPKVEGLAVTTKWTFRLIGNTESELRASMEKAFKAHPDWFDLKARARVIEAAIKAADGKLECDGLTFFQDTKTRAT